MEIILTILVAVSAFIATNLDDMLILIAFFAREDFNNISVVIGQYIGVSFLIIISSFGVFFQIYNTSILYCIIRNFTHCYRIKKPVEFKGGWFESSFK